MRAGVGQEDCKLYMQNIKKCKKKIDHISDAQKERLRSARAFGCGLGRHLNSTILLLQAHQRFGNVSYILTRVGIHSSQKHPSRHAKQDWDLA
jgi:hypothetical protein